MLKGIECPVGGAQYEFKDCLQCAKLQRNKCDYDYAILACMFDSIRGDVGISTTQLLNCLRKVVLENKCNYYTPVNRLFFGFRGQLFHTILEKAKAEGAIVRTRFHRELNGLSLSGEPDALYPELGKISDYKSTKKVPWSDKPHGNHDWQVNIYRYLVGDKYDIKSLEIIYFDMVQAKRLPVQVKSTQEVEEFILPRLGAIAAGIGGGVLPLPVGAEGRWQCNGYCDFGTMCFGSKAI